MKDFPTNKLAKYKYCFRKGFGTQDCLLLMIEKLWKIQNNKQVFAAVFTDLSKTFDCASYELLIAKLNAYGIDKMFLNFILAYFNNRKQKQR